MTEEQKQQGMTVNCKMIMNCDCDVILKESKCDLKKITKGIFAKLGNAEAIILLYYNTYLQCYMSRTLNNLFRKGECDLENKRRGGTALACLVIEIEAEEWCAALCQFVVERGGAALGRGAYVERKYSAILEA